MGSMKAAVWELWKISAHTRKESRIHCNGFNKLNELMSVNAAKACKKLVFIFTFSCSLGYIEFVLWET